LLTALSLSSVGCSSEEEYIAPELPVASSIEMQIPKSELTVGETINLTAIVKDNLGNIMDGQPLIWTSSNPNVISIDSDGLAEAKSEGTASIEVKTQTEVKVASNFTVIMPEVEDSPQEPHSFVVTPEEIIIEIGQKVQIEIKVFDIEGDEIENPEILYKSLDEQVSTVSDSGLVEGIRVGSSKILIEVSNKSTEVPVTVISEELVLSKIEVSPNNISADRGDQVQFSVKAFDQFDQEMSGITFDWTTSNGCRASIDEDGLAYVYTPGNVRMTASVGEISGFGTIAVSKSENLEAESFEGKWSICRESNGDNFATVELKIESTNDITRLYEGELNRPDGSTYIIRGTESIASKSIAIDWDEIVQGGARTFSIVGATFIDEFAVEARHNDRRTLETYDVILSKIEE
jgi:uncharacterized protein YjdB